tara:strand:- start:1605 stop:2807 length:1203 start_codon:yes stop_codon:yes gene_type:complete
MGFKMKRSGMSLRSTTRIQPQLTNLQSNQSSPIHQQVDAEFDAGQVDQSRDDDGNILLRGERPGEGGRSSDGGFGRACKGKNDGSTGYDPVTKKSYKCLRDPNYVRPTETPGYEDEESYSLSMDTPETSGNMLTPREMRRNYRATDIFRRRQEDLIRRANKDYRQAIRRGETPPPGVMKILSGEYLGNMDGVNQGQASTGTTNLFTGQKTFKFNPKTGGGKKDLNDALAAETARLIAAKEEAGEKFELSDIKKQATQTVSDNYIAEGKVNVYNPGQYLSKRSRSLSDNRGLTPGDFGDYGLKGRSQRKVDRDARKVTGYKEELMKGVIKNQNADKENGEPEYQYDPNNKEGMSKKEYDRLKRKITKRRGDKSAFKQKDSPINMTVNITKPSYKMGGFGSK